MRGDPAVLVEDLDGVGREPHVDLAAAQRVGDAVERVLDLDVVVDVDPGLAPLGVLVALGRERPERGAVQILEPAAAAALDLLERPLVQLGQQRPDGLAEFAEREERPVAQRRHDAALDVLDRGLRLGLVPRSPVAARGAPWFRSGRPAPGTSRSARARSGWPCGPPPSRCPGSRVRERLPRTRTSGRATSSSPAATGSGSRPRRCGSTRRGRRRRPSRRAPRRSPGPPHRTSAPRSRRTPSRPPDGPAAWPRRASPATPGSARRTSCYVAFWIMWRTGRIVLSGVTGRHIGAT